MRRGRKKGTTGKNRKSKISKSQRYASRTKTSYVRKKPAKRNEQGKKEKVKKFKTPKPSILIRFGERTKCSIRKAARRMNVFKKLSSGATLKRGRKRRNHRGC